MSSSDSSKGGDGNQMPPPPFDVPSRSDSILRIVSNLIGGPLGRYAVIGRNGISSVLASLMVLASITIALGVFQKGHCLMKGWTSPDQFWRACYSDITVVNLSSTLTDRGFPYAGDAPVDQPLLGGLTMWLLSLLSPFSGGDLAAQRSIFVLWAVVALLLLGLGAVAVVGLKPTRPWQAAHLVASPVLVFLALVSVDLLGVVLVLWALWMWQRDEPIAAGVLLGLAFLLRPYPLVFLLAIILVSISTRRLPQALQATLAAVLAAVALYLPMLLIFGDSVLAPLRGWVAAGPGYGSLMLAVESVGVPISSGTATSIAILGWALALGVGYWVAHHRPSPSILVVAAPMMLTVALSAQSVPVQTGLWLLPFAALSALSWRDHLIWAAAEIIHFEAVWLRIADASDPGRGIDGVGYGVFVIIRYLGWGWLLWQVARTPAPSALENDETLAGSSPGGEVLLSQR